MKSRSRNAKRRTPTATDRCAVAVRADNKVLIVGGLHVVGRRSPIDAHLPIDRLPKAERTGIVHDLNPVAPYTRIAVDGIEFNLEAHRIVMPPNDIVRVHIDLPIGNI